ncbi:response regulator [Zobellia alginiliquefaciens]|uniref:response regulator n=1 Tax=Zobellia alginiliquefaciens TaxID=3032586 RepID=UPI0023E3B201|nr:response regulator [Zobellia alginiliquefaciens]
MKPPFHLCIVDDDDIYRFTVLQTAKTLNMEYRTTVFSNGQDALEYIQANQNNPETLPHFILLDIDMPVMDGFQFLQSYDDIEPTLTKNITIYMVSSSVDPKDIELAKSYSSVKDYISKPLKSEQLKTIIDTIIPN